MQILTFSEYQAQSERLAAILDRDCHIIECHHFPDGESLVRLPTDLAEHVVICRSLNQPNDKLIELLLTAKTARALGAKRLTLVAPYLCYMRQDIANRPGEAVSQEIIGHLLAELFDDVITVDPHLHRIQRLSEAIPLKNAITLTAAVDIGDFLRQQFDSAVLLGPDAESKQWVSAIAEQTGFDYAVAHKQRLGDKKVVVTLPEYDFCSKSVVLVDDVLSTGRTLTQAATLLQKAGAGEVYAAVTHPLFCGDAEAALYQAGIKQVWSCDSVAHKTACIYLAQRLAQALLNLQ